MNDQRLFVSNPDATKSKRLFVSPRNESPKMFENPFLDFFSRIHYASVPILFIPITSWFVYQAIFVHNIAWQMELGLFFCGYAFWTLLEYFIHRIVFHHTFTSRLGKEFLHIAHGVHHDYPNDALRLVMPPAINLTLATIVYWFFYLVLQDKGITAGAFAGLAFGYMVYDLVHYASHFHNFKWKWFQSIKRSHLLHHYRNPNSGYGLSTVFWDRVFGTLHPPEAKVSLPKSD